MIEMTTVDKEGRAKIEPVILVPKDYVQVVRCKDCKWYDNIGCALIIVDEEDRPKPDDYCSYGERKEE